MIEDFKPPGLVGPVETAQKHLVFVIAERLDGKLDGEQAEQAREALNGTRKDE